MSATARVALLFGVLTAILIGFGYIVSYFVSNIYILFFMIGLNILIIGATYFLADRFVLWSYNARIVSEHEYPRLYRMVRKVSEEAKIPMPRVAIVPIETPNAFATGRNPKNAVVAVTEGILRLLNDSELEGVISHEISHIKNRDILVMTIASMIAATISVIARFFFWEMIFGRSDRREVNPVMLAIGILGMILVPIAAILIQLAISRTREYKADESGAKIIKNPNSLADALLKLQKGVERRPLLQGNPATSSMFIVNPFSKNALVRLLSTHPPIEERVKRLREMKI